MLVLTRKKNECIVIRGKDGDIRVVVVDAEKGKVRLGIEAPMSCAVVREELLTEIENANRMAALSDLDSVKKLIGGGR